MKESEKIKAKLEKLLKHQASAADIGNLEEAASFAAKAQELMAKYNLENFELKEEKESDSIEGEKINLNEEHNWTKVQGKWMMKMYASIAMYNFCQIVISDTIGWPKREDGTYDTSKKYFKVHQLYIMGEPLNIGVVRFISTQLINRLKVLQSLAWKEYQGYEKKGQFRRGYFEGAVIAIRNKLYEQQKHSEEQYEGMTGLIKLTNVAINEKIEEDFGKLNRSRSSNSRSSSGKSRGYQDGKEIDIHKGVSGDGNASRRLT